MTINCYRVLLRPPSASVALTPAMTMLKRWASLPEFSMRDGPVMKRPRKFPQPVPGDPNVEVVSVFFLAPASDSATSVTKKNILSPSFALGLRLLAPTSSSLLRLYLVLNQGCLEPHLRLLLHCDVLRLQPAYAIGWDKEHNDAGVVFLHPRAVLIADVRRPTVNQPKHFP
jgi:hypothetical protein